MRQVDIESGPQLALSRQVNRDTQQQAWADIRVPKTGKQRTLLCNTILSTSKEREKAGWASVGGQES